MCVSLVDGMKEMEKRTDENCSEPYVDVHTAIFVCSFIFGRESKSCISGGLSVRGSFSSQHMEIVGTEKLKIEELTDLNQVN